MIDALKAVASQAIVLHHLAFYGPMCDAVRPYATPLVDGLAEHGRLAVQVFLVVGGFLTARALAPHGSALAIRPVAAVARRWARLAGPYVVTIGIAVAAAAVARAVANHPDAPEPPTARQLLANLAMLQDLVGEPAVSAGLWYVAIDLQVYAFATGIVWACGRFGAAGALPAAVAAVAAVSLLGFNRDARWDTTGFYFFGSYALGMLAAWSGPDLVGRFAPLAIAALGGIALVAEFRTRVAVATATALLLAWAVPRGSQGGWPASPLLGYLARISYAVFLIQFPVCLVIEAAAARWFAGDPLASAAGLAVAWAASIGAGAALHRWVEAPVAAAVERRRMAAPTNGPATLRPGLSVSCILDNIIGSWRRYRTVRKVDPVGDGRRTAAGGMEICVGRHLLAPSVWARDVEVYDATVRIDAPPAPAAIAVAAARIDAALPQRRGLFGAEAKVAPADSSAGAVWARLLGEVALTLQTIARKPATPLLRVLPAAGTKTFRLVLQAHDPRLAAACLQEAIGLLDRAAVTDLPDLAPLLDRLTLLADDVCVGPSTMLIVDAAAARGIPWRRLGGECLVQLGQGRRQHRIWTAETDRTSAIAEGISRDKQLTKQLLAAAGVPVPVGRTVTTAAEAWEAAQAIGLPVVVKPLDANHGRGVFLDLSLREEIERAVPVAAEEGRRVRTVVVEQFVPGLEHRLLVIGGRMVACAKGEHIHVTGDGRHTVAELIDLQINSDPRRGISEAMPNKTVKLEATVLAQLARAGVTPETVPTAGSRVLVNQIGTHGIDATALVHPDMAAMAERAARAVGLDIAGIDVIARDIAQPPHGQGAKVCEVNAGPQLMIHANPSQGPGQPVGRAIVDELFAPGDDGRIPVVLVAGCGTGAEGDAATGAAALLAGLLRAAGRTPGLACAAGRLIGQLECSAAPAVDPDAARDLLVSPEIDAMVCELDWHAVAVRGLPADRCDALVLGRMPVEPPADVTAAAGVAPLAVFAALVESVAATGTIVLAEADEACARLAADSGRKVVVVDPACQEDPPRQAAMLAAVALGLAPERIARPRVSNRR
jgi:cyanophycin synthetase